MPPHPRVLDERETAREAIADILTKHLEGRAPLTGLIVDNPSSANWRLKPALGGGLRLAYYGDNPEREQLAADLTLRMQELTRPYTGLFSPFSPA